MKTATGPARLSAAGALRLAAAGACVLAVATLGCNAGTGTVSGKVTYHGQPVPAGTVTCLTKDNRPFLGKIESDGTYTVTGVPIGPVTIGVEGGRGAEEPPIPLPTKDKPPPKTLLPISGPKPSVVVQLPKQYANPDSSGLRLTVVRGTNPFNIELK